MIDVLPNADERGVIDSVAAVLADLCPVSRLRAAGAPAAAETKAWRQFAAAGWFGMAVPEDLGGVGMTLNEEALMFREFGRHLLSPRVLATSLGAQLAARCGDAGLASAIVSGERPVGLASAIGAVRASAEIVEGELHLMDGGASDLALLVLADGGALLPRSALRKLRGVAALDGQVALERADVAGAKPLAWLPTQGYALHRHALVLLAAQQVGIAEATRDMAVEHAKTREQFGKPIGSFQAIAHHCADMAVRAEAAYAQTLFAAIAARDGREDADLHVAAAALIAQDAAFQNATLNIRVHGGIGFTAQCDAHHYLKRAMLLARVAGDARGLHQALLREPD